MSTMLKPVAAGIVFALVLSPMLSVAGQRLDRSKFHIGAYYFKDNIADEAHVKELVECGMDFMVGVPVKSRKTLDLFQKHGVGAIVNGVVPSWCGGGTNCARIAELRPLQGYADSLDAFVKELDHPAIWMIDLTDEPGATAFGHFGAVCRLFREKCPDVLPYVNLFPNYASHDDPKHPERETHLCIGTYQQYIDHYTEMFPLSYISYDHYMMRDNPNFRRPLYFENLRIVSEACRNTGRDLWFIPGVNTTWKDRRVSENQLRYQAFSSMAYGTVNIAWACWCVGWWNFNIYDKDGKRDDIQFAALKTVNLEIRKLAEQYMRFKNVGTRLLSTNLGDDFEYYDGWFNRLRSADRSSFAVGTMVSRDIGSKERAVLVFAAADPDDVLKQTRKFVFSAAGKVRAYGPCGEVPLAQEGVGQLSFSLKDSYAVLLVCE